VKKGEGVCWKGKRILSAVRGARGGIHGSEYRKLWKEGGVGSLMGRK